MHALSCSDLLVGETLGAHHRRPRRRGMAATHELFVLGAVTVTTVGGRQGFGDLEPVVTDAVLTLLGLVAVQAVHSASCMIAALELVDDGRRLVPVATRTLSFGADKVRSRMCEL